MKPEDEICYCYHVSLGKLVNFAKRTQPRRASQMSQCLGAGTGCGWCIPILKRIHEQCSDGACSSEEVDAVVEMTPEEYAAAREAYIRESKPKNRF